MKRLLREPLAPFPVARCHNIRRVRLRGAGLWRCRAVKTDSADHRRPFAVVRVFRSQWRRDPSSGGVATASRRKGAGRGSLSRSARARKSTRTTRSSSAVWRRRCSSSPRTSPRHASLRPRSLRHGTRRTATSSRYPPRVSFRHLYFSPDRRGGRARDDAAAALTKLAGQPEDSKLVANLADKFMFQEYYRDRTPEFLGKELGPNFALSIAKLSPGSWQGPVSPGSVGISCSSTP